MNEALLKLKVKNAKKVKQSLEVDKSSNVTIKAKRNFLEIRIVEKKLSHLKAIINSYISLVNMLAEVSKNE